MMAADDMRCIRVSSRESLAPRGGQSPVRCGSSVRIRRVVLVISELRPGGAERVVAHLARALPDHGVRPLVICLQQKGALGEELEAAGVSVTALGSMRGYDFRAGIRLGHELRRFRPDVINVHDRSSLPYVVLANRISGRRPVVFSAHGLLMQDERPRLRDRLAARDVQQVTAVSRPAAREYARLLGWRGAVEIIDNGVPPVERSEALRRELRSSLGVPDGTFVFLSVGNIKPEKGFEDLLAATSVMAGQVDRCSFLVLIVGGAADREYHRMLIERQQNLALNGAVRFLGFRSEMQALYSAADGFVLCSRKEGLPMVLLEAMSAGLPVIATEVGAVPDVIRSGWDGLLVPPASPGRLAASMERLLSDAELRGRLGDKAGRRVRDEYSIEGMTSRYLATYEQCFIHKGKPRVVSHGEGRRI